MKDWKAALKDSLATGTAASLVSTLALAACGRRETGSMYAPTNAVSHWVWGDRAAMHNEPSLRYTGLGFLIHHLSAMFWGVIYEKVFGKTPGRNEVVPTLASSAAMAGIACFVDYKMTPRRLQPGYEMRLSKKSLFAVYAAFAVGLAVPALLQAQKRAH